MSSLRSLVHPRKEVLEATLDETIFAANLGTVLQGTAPSVYGDPAEFFSRTHPSSGLKALLNLCLGRLGGAEPDAPPIIRIDTNLGGGKTHNLIALSHAVRGGLDAGSAGRLLSPSVRQTLGHMPGVCLAAFVGTDHGVSASESTMWGLLANRLGGASGYALVRPDNAQGQAGGRNLGCPCQPESVSDLLMCLGIHFEGLHNDRAKPRRLSSTPIYHPFAEWRCTARLPVLQQHHQPGQRALGQAAVLVSHVQPLQETWKAALPPLGTQASQSPRHWDAEHRGRGRPANVHPYPGWPELNRYTTSEAWLNCNEAATFRTGRDPAFPPVAGSVPLRCAPLPTKPVVLFQLGARFQPGLSH